MADSSVEEQLEQVRAELDKEEKRWQDAKLPGPKSLYKMGENEMMHHCHLKGLTNLLQEKLDISDDEILLAIETVFLQECKDLFPRVIEMRRELRRQAIVDGVKP